MNRLLIRHAAVWILGGALFRLAVVPAEACPDVTPDTTRAAAVAAGDWLVRNMDETGRFLYGYDRAADEINPDYHVVRHAGAMNSLYQLAIAGETQFLEPADRALGYLLEHRIEHDGWTTIALPGAWARLGTTGFTVVALVQRRAITGDAGYDELMRSLGRFILAQQEADGSISALWNPITEQRPPNRYGKFATGEAVWALVELENTFPGEGWWEAAELTLHYLADGSRAAKEGYPARLPDHWAAYALAAAGPVRLDDELIGYAERLAGYFSVRLRLEAQRTGTPLNVAVRGFPGPPAGVGTAAEGMAALYRLAGEDSRLASVRPNMAERLACNAGLMVEQQVAPAEASAEPEPGLVEGAWFYRSYTQVDDQQHVLSGLLGAELAMREEDS